MRIVTADDINRVLTFGALIGRAGATAFRADIATPLRKHRHFIRAAVRQRGQAVC